MGPIIKQELALAIVFFICGASTMAAFEIIDYRSGYDQAKEDILKQSETNLNPCLNNSLIVYIPENATNIKTNP